ncbi:Lipopolysaccharide biosynthesis protein wzxC [Streptococcus pneumoniae]|nr:Lipopolysaccharide biosynthesis protein wzxC [Streptococcus pneumoniae]
MRFFSASGPFWVFVQHGAGRIAVALKFLVLARVLGNDGVGIIGVGLLAIVVAEALSELGLMQALVQRRGEVTQAQLSAVWGWQLLRAGLLGFVMVLFSWPVAQFFSMPEAFPVFMTVGLLLFLRGSVNLSITLALRDMQMKRVGLFNAGFVILDALLGILVAWLTRSVLAVFLTMLIAESARCIASYLVFPRPPRPTLSREASEFAAFGKWIWINNVLVLLLNQSDKFIIAKFFGVGDMGIYQISQRFAQLGVADVGGMLSQYLFPKLSEQMRVDQRAAVRLTFSLLLLLAAVGMVAVLAMCSIAESMFVFLLGEDWRVAGLVFEVLAFGMYGALLNSVLVPFIKAEGKVWIITCAMLLQLVAFAILLYFKWDDGIVGVAYASSMSVWLATLLILIGSICGVKYAAEFFSLQWRMWILLVFCSFVLMLPKERWWLGGGVAFYVLLRGVYNLYGLIEKNEGCRR